MQPTYRGDGTPDRTGSLFCPAPGDAAMPHPRPRSRARPGRPRSSARRRHPSFTGDKATAHAVAAQLVRHHRISDATYAAAIDAFGETGLVELVTTVGYYCLISVTLNAFEIPLPDDWDDPFPD